MNEAVIGKMFEILVNQPERDTTSATLDGLTFKLKIGA